MRTYLDGTHGGLKDFGDFFVRKVLDFAEQEDRTQVGFDAMQCLFEQFAVLGSVCVRW